MAASSITEEGLAALRREMHVETELPQYNTLAGADAIRHYALGIGDDNPRWLDESHAARSPWGGLIAPPTFVMTCGFARSRGLPGVHGLFTGIDLHCHAPIKAGTRVVARTALHDVVERHGRYAGREFQQIYVTRYRDETGKELSTLYSHAFRTEREAGGSKGKYAAIERQSYSDADIAAIDEEYAAEVRRRRGDAPLFWEDVQPGEAIPTVTKGPLTVTDCICFLMGFGYIYVRAHRQWSLFRQRHPGAGVKDSHGVPDVPERVHWEEELPRDIGMPTAYDYGPQRIGWFDHCVSDWMGDHGWVRRLKVTLTGPNFIGDTTRIGGTVSGRNAADSSVTLDLTAEDQRGRITARGLAEIVLPRR